ncbi:MAG: C69 family dipeptidase [Clostridiales bacterium]|nr:C69 family dipeptidase [Clostridiales bacterium]
MCDTMVALGNCTKDGSVIFAKNSDRQPNEPHIIVRVPRSKHALGEKVKCTYIEIEQVEETYEVLLLKPSWIWGCEMGCNEFGLNIGNEAVFTKEKEGKDSLTGMDMIRIALERCKTSDEALDMIIYLLGKYGQGGNCGYEKKFTYHNSFLIADKKSAWVIETAGKYWAAEKVTGVRNISNCLTIGNKFDKCHPDLIKHAVDKGWCKDERDFNFAKCYSNRVITKFSGSKSRFSTARDMLNREKGSITVDIMKQMLRSHEGAMDGRQFSRGSLKSICMHGGLPIGDHTTGSYIASLNDRLCTYWITGASTPCISIFKPFWMIDGEHMSFKENEKEKAIEYWRKREKLHRLFIENRISDVDSYYTGRDNLENSFSKMANMIEAENLNSTRCMEIMDYAMKKEEEFIDLFINKYRKNTPHIKGSPYFKFYWRKQINSFLKGM